MFCKGVFPTSMMIRITWGSCKTKFPRLPLLWGHWTSRSHQPPQEILVIWETQFGSTWPFTVYLLSCSVCCMCSCEPRKKKERSSGATGPEPSQLSLGHHQGRGAHPLTDKVFSTAELSHPYKRRISYCVGICSFEVLSIVLAWYLEQQGTSLLTWPFDSHFKP